MCNQKLFDLAISLIRNLWGGGYKRNDWGVYNGKCLGGYNCFDTRLGGYNCFDTRLYNCFDTTVTFSPNSYYVTQPSNVQPFSSGGTTFYVGDPKTLDAAIYSKSLMVPYTNENKQYGPFTSSSSKPITNQDLAEILTLSQKGPCLNGNCLLSTEIRCSGLNGLVSSKVQSMQKF